MKNVRMFISATLVLAVVASALAFTTKKSNFCLFKPGTTSCVFDKFVDDASLTQGTRHQTATSASFRQDDGQCSTSPNATCDQTVYYENE